MNSISRNYLTFKAPKYEDDLAVDNLKILMFLRCKKKGEALDILEVELKKYLNYREKRGDVTENLSLELLELITSLIASI